MQTELLIILFTSDTLMKLRHLGMQLMKQAIIFMLISLMNILAVMVFSATTGTKSMFKALRALVILT